MDDHTHDPLTCQVCTDEVRAGILLAQQRDYEEYMMERIPDYAKWMSIEQNGFTTLMEYGFIPVYERNRRA